MNFIYLPFDLIWNPLANLLPLRWLFFLISFGAGIGILAIHRGLSEKLLVRDINARIVGSILEVWMGRDSLAVILRAQLRIVILSLWKIVVEWKALLALIVFVVYILLSLEVYCEYRPLAPGESATMEMASLTSSRDITLTAGENLEIQTPLLWIEPEQKAVWRIAARESSVVDISTPSGDFKVSVQAAESTDAMLHRASAGPGISIYYPDRVWSYLGHEAHWIVWFSLFAIIGAGVLAAIWRPTLVYR